MTTPLLSIRRASKHYGGTAALIDAALDLNGGEIHALMGENGAGKSTLIRLLAGVTPPDTMEVSLRGQPVQINSPASAFALGLRFIHQELNIVPQLSVAENVYLSQPYPRRLGALVDWRRLNAGARAALEQLVIAHIDPKMPMARLSTGDRMLVKIASAFLSDAAVYVLDEPTAALTGAEAERLFAVLGTLKGKGAAVLYVSHRMEEIFRLCDRVTVMRDGRVVATEPIGALTPGLLIEQMTGRTLAGAYPARAEGTSPGGPLLEVRDLTTAAVRGITFTLRVGEILGVAGLQGAGRTELLQALAGADRIVSGRVAWGDGTPYPTGVTAVWTNGAAYVPEERRAQGLVLSRSVRDNVTLPHLGAVSRGGALLDRGAETALAGRLGQGVRLKARGVTQRVRELSGGNQQKVVFARALARGPRLLLLDEPTRGVDVGAKYDIYTLIRESSAGGAGVLLASSDLAELIGLSDRILILRGRRQAALVDAAGLTQAGLLALCYGE